VALGTAFDISNDADFVSISVDHGVVEVRGADTAAVGTLAAGEWMTLDPATAQAERGTRDAAQIAAWRSGMMVAEREHVSALVARIARWQSGMVIVADPSVGQRVVSGVFDLSNPTRALEAVVRPFGGKVHQVAPFLTVIAPV
jgi:transmembrane sensor